VTCTTVKVTIFKILKEPEMIALYGNSVKKFKASFHWLTSFYEKIQIVFTLTYKNLQNRLKNYWNNFTNLSPILELKNRSNFVIFLIWMRLRFTLTWREILLLTHRR
jgi:hypothetical protein